MAKPVSVQHLAGGPIGGIQRCERCGMVLIDHSAHRSLYSVRFDSGSPERRYMQSPPECSPCSRRKRFSAA